MPDSSPNPHDAAALEERLRRLEAAQSAILEQNRQLAAQNQELATKYHELSERYEALQAPPTPVESVSTDTLQPPAPSLPQTAANSAPTPAVSSAWTPPTPAVAPSSRYGVDYDDGFILFRDEEGVTPFELKLNIWNQFRYFGFARAVRDWTDSAGITVPINNRSDFEIVRGRLIFSGFAYDPRFHYYVNFDYNTVAGDNVTLLAAWVNYKFNEYFNLHLGKEKVWGVREWIESGTHTLGADRTMATTFFRPSRTAGIWSVGQLTPELNYRAMVGNGFNTSTARFDELDTNMSYSGDLVWEPWGPFGRTFADLQWHDDPVIRLGTNVVTARQSGSQRDSGDPEQTQIRLSDGTLLTTKGALAPDVTVQHYVISLWSLDAGFKYRGLSVSGEYFLRWLSEIEGDGPLDTNHLFDHGLYAQAGYFLIPERFELFARTSQITGPFGHGSEYSGGLNWYFKGLDRLRFTADVIREFHSPTQQVRTGYEAGASGTMIRLQMWSVF